MQLAGAGVAKNGKGKVQKKPAKHLTIMEAFKKTSKAAIEVVSSQQ